jgi:hypothetical protein
MSNDPVYILDINGKNRYGTEGVFTVLSAELVEDDSNETVLVEEE